GSDLVWTVTLYPCEGTCAGQNLHTTTGASGSFTAPDSPYPSRIEISLRATDPYGLNTTVTRVLQPDTAQITFATNPAGRSLNIDGVALTGPQTRTYIVGSSIEMIAPS